MNCLYKERKKIYKPLDNCLVDDIIVFMNATTKMFIVYGKVAVDEFSKLNVKGSG